MDFPCFRQLCFLLLTTAAPRPNIAMPLPYHASDKPAERILGISFVKTKVTVYHCKDCESDTCETSSYENFRKLVETQNETFSNGKIHLEINPANITMCFCQENTSREGIYAIFWEKAMGLGHSCDIVKMAAFSENMSDHIGKICCVLETKVSVPNNALKCYPNTLDENITTAAAITSEEGDPGDPQHLITNGTIASGVVLVFFATALAMYCIRRKRSGKGSIILVDQLLQLLENRKDSCQEGPPASLKNIYK